MKVTKIRNHRDGSATMTLETTEAEMDGLILEGLRVVFAGSAVKVLSMEEARKAGVVVGKKGWRRLDVSKELVDRLAGMGVLEILKRAIEKAKKRRKECRRQTAKRTRRC